MNFDFNDPKFIARMKLMAERSVFLDIHNSMMNKMHDMWQEACKLDTHRSWADLAAHIQKSIDYVHENERLSPSRDIIYDQYDILLRTATERSKIAS